MDWMKSGWCENGQFYIDASNAIHSNRELLTVASETIKRITDHYPAPYTLMMSGGVDSQSMLWCWINSNTTFNVTTVRYIDHNGTVLNEHDISNMKAIAKLHNIVINYIDFNIIDFLDNHLFNYATKYQCTSPQITAYMKMSEMIETGTVLFSGDFLATAAYDYTIFGLKRYADAINTESRKVIPFFLLHDPELTTIYKVINDTKTYDRSGAKNLYYKQKINSMQAIGIPIIPQKSKYSGFEKIKNIYDTRYDLVVPTDRIRYAGKPSRRIFDVIFRYNLTKIIHYEDKLKWII